MSMRTLHEDNVAAEASSHLRPGPHLGPRCDATRPRPLYLRIVDALAADVASGRVAADTQAADAA